MKVLVTGGSGMLGSAVVNFASLGGHQVLSPSHGELDLNEQIQTFEYLKRHSPDAIIHCAAKVGGISANVANPLEFLTKNIRMDSSLLGAAMELDIENLIYIGSSCMYPKDLPHAMTESEILSGPLEPTNEGYALAKLAGWKTVQFMASRLTWRSFILSNLYGPHDHFEPGRSHLLAAIIEKIHSAKIEDFKSVNMWGDGSAKREFTFVEDVALFLIESLGRLNVFPDTLNIGAGVDYSVLEYYKFVSRAMNYEGEIQADLTKPTGMRRKLMDISQARGYGWAPQTSIESGIQKTARWYEESLRKTIQ
ncbi:MAG: NAD-dependent epimerase/dehydratase family protein [Streptomycetaceae bacterium]|nr:MAG: NAD-dependent epimerase/dehydratase family protein [Streptomycetaceae bacterium]